MSCLLRVGALACAGIACVAAVYWAATTSLQPVAQEALTRPRIFAYRDWQSVGVRLNPDDRVSIRAQGEWLYTPGEYHGPEGHARYSAPAFYPLPRAPGGALIGRIGVDGEPFLVGRRASRRATETGTLYLRIDDDILTDNDGWVQVSVEVQPAE
jgi:hypothetical protein